MTARGASLVICGGRKKKKRRSSNRKSFPATMSYHVTNCWSGTVIRCWLILAFYLSLTLASPPGTGLARKFSVPENSAPGTWVGSIPASEQSVKYVIANNKDDVTRYFDEGLLTSQGRIETIRTLDHELVRQINFMVYEQKSRSLTQVTVEVEDENDNSPHFRKSHETIRMSEATPINKTFAISVAVDADSFPNDVRKYSIIRRSLGAEIFSLRSFLVDNVANAELILTASLDRENVSAYEIWIEARDGGFQQRSDVIKYDLVVDDVNDNRPAFVNGSRVTVTVREDMRVGAHVITAVASDLDEGENGQVSYAIDRERSDSGGYFRADSDTGSIYLARRLDAEAKKRHEIWLRAADRGRPSLSGTMIITVLVGNVNDNDPTIVVEYMKPERTKISEDVDVGEVVARITVTDPDATDDKLTTANVTLSSTDSFGLRTDDNITHYLYIKRKLDRESKSIYHITLEATDYGSPPRSASKTVTFHVKDVNDNEPVFDDDDIRVQLSTSASPGTFIYQVNAKDADIGENARIRYRIIHSLHSSCCNINADSGLITTARTLDLKILPSLLPLAVEARDMGRPASLWSTANVTVELLSHEDATGVGGGEPPRFISRQYSAEVRENTAPETCILQLACFATTDPSFASTSIVYELVVITATSGGTDEDVIDPSFLFPFRIDSITGRLYTAGALDRELTSVYHASVVARDEYGQTDEVPLVVEITDINDNRPLFDPAEYLVNVSRQIESGWPILALQATDADFGANGKITFHIDSEEGDLPFRVEPRSGLVSTHGDLSFISESQINFTIIAIDGGGMISSNHASVVINLIPAPFIKILQFAKTRYEFSTVENTPVGGSSVGWVSAFYPQANRDNEGISYSIQAHLPVSDWLFIRPNTGEIFLQKELDREALSVIQLKIIATSLTETNTFATTDLQITVLDVNDNRPLFVSNSPPTATFGPATLPTSPAVTHLKLDYTWPIEKTIHTIVATDGDAGANGTVLYAVAESSPYFHIDSRSGEVGLRERLPQTVKNYTIVITASDQGSPPQSSSTTLVIETRPKDIMCPRFLQRKLSINVREDLPVTSWIKNLEASVVDNSTTIYDLKQADDSHLFTLKRESGALYLKESLDRETREVHQITVLAAANPTRSDLFGTSCTDQLLVELHVLDVNDNSPQFIHSFHYFHLLEDREAGIFVGKVEACDEDAGENGRIIYSLLPKNDQFDIEYDTGKIFLVGPIDREERQEYKFEVIASDGGGRKTSTVVHIHIDDVNDNKPQFVGGSTIERRIISLSDKLKKGAAVADLQAHDSDEGMNAILEYHMQSDSSDADIFTIDSSTGVVSLTRALNQGDVGTHLVNVTARDRGTPTALTNHKALQVHIVNDKNAADGGRFDENSFVFVTGEQQLQPGALLGSVAVDTSSRSRKKRDITTAAVDKLDGEDLYVCKYYLSSGNTDGDLYLNETSGELYITRRLVHARNPNYEVTIKRVVNDVIDDTSPITVFVYVEEGNLHVPIFERGQYIVNVTEDSPINTEIWKVVALDEDAGRNGRIQYSFSNQTTGDAFEIDAVSGILRVAASLDRETTSKYLLVVNASDGALQSPHHTSATVVVNIIDVNDNHPVIFSRGDIYVSEDRSASTEIAVIMSRDDDVGVNALVTYDIEFTNSSDRDLFSIDSETGSLTLTQRLDYESCLMHCFNVTATDGLVAGVNRLKREQVFCVHVIDVNDVEPIFERQIYNSTIAEDANVGDFVATVHANDGEQGMNGEITYSITNTSGSQYFHIDPRNGVISLKKKMDYETMKSYSFEVVARDGGNPPLTGSCVVEVDVTDVNDNSPVIHPSHYNQYNSFTTFPIIARIRIEEVIYEAGTLIYTVVASDLDSGENGRLHYSITDGDEDGYFEISANDGGIYTTRVLDREHSSLYWLRVTVSDGNPATLQRTSVGIVQVEVVDWNDNLPVFVEHSYSGSVAEEQVRGQYVTTVRAHDADAGLNAKVTYSLSSDDIQSESSFEVDHLTGVVTSARSLDRESRGVHYLQVTAHDSSLQRPLNSSVSLVVHVSDINDNYPIFENNLLIHPISSRTKLNNVQVIAHDIDEGVNGHVTYRLLNHQSSFTIDRNTGRISQYNILPDGVYKLKVSATDGGTPSKQSFAFVQVEIGTTLPANARKITQTSYRVDIPEAVQVDHRVLTVQLASNVQLRGVEFEFLAGNELQIFDLTRDGDVIVINPSPLDYETRPNISLVASVRSRNLSSNLTEDEELVLISMILQDENDNAPIFSKSEYRVSIMEEQPVTAFVTKVQAYDVDMGANNLIKYSIISAVPQNPFEIDEESGEIFTKFPLDREIHEEYILTVRGTDQGFPPRRTITSVRITVLDINDHAPVLVTPSERVGIREDAIVGTVVMQATANDVDLYPIVSFQLIGEQSNEYFTIHRSNGNVMLKKEVDYEQMKELSLTIKASDEVHQVNKTLVININDCNDNSPVFDANPPVQHITIDQSSIDVGREITQMIATDEDSGEMGRVEYSIINSKVDFFQIHQQTGKITTTKHLKNIQPEIHLQIKASDCHPPFHTTIASLQIQITNLESSNRLIFPEESYEARISELVIPGHVVMNLLVSGTLEQHHECFFKIINGDENEVFNLQTSVTNVSSTYPCSTDVIVRKHLNYQHKNVYNLKIAVRTSDQNDFQSFTDVKVDLENVKDKPLIFEEDYYVASVTENSKDEFPHVTKFVISVSVQDPGESNDIEFSILSGDDYESFYLRQCIPARIGCITINARELDYELISKYVLTIQARNKNAGQSTGISTTVVTINVIDIDESAPKFAITNYKKSVVECASANSTLFAVVADDEDAGRNLTYTIDMIEGRQLIAQDRNPFQINPKSGQIVAVNELDYERRTRYDFRVNVLASDGDIHDHVTVQLHILPFDEYPPVFDLGNLTAFHFSVPYGSAPDFIVGQISATDEDAGDHVTYELNQLADTSFPFQIDSNSGMIFLRYQLLTPHDHTIQVDASSSPRQRSSMEIMIEVTNIPEALSQSHVIGLVIGTIGGVIILFIFFVLFTFRRRKKRNSPSSSTRNKKQQQQNGEVNVASLNEGCNHENNQTTSKMNGTSNISKSLHVKASNGINKTTVRAEKLEMKNISSTKVEHSDENGGDYVNKSDVDKINNNNQQRRTNMVKKEEADNIIIAPRRMNGTTQASSSVTSQSQRRQCPIGSSTIKTRGGDTKQGREIENGEIMHRNTNSCPPTANGGMSRHHHVRSSSRRCKSPNSTHHVQVDPSFCQKKPMRDDHHRSHAVSPPPQHNNHHDVTPHQQRHQREYLSSSSTSAKCPFTSPTPSGSYVSSVTSSAAARDQQQSHQWTPEFTPLADVIDEIAKLRQEFSRDVSGGHRSPYQLVVSPGDRPPLLTSTLQNKAAVTQPVPHHSPTDQRRRAGTNPRKSSVRGQPPSYDATMRRMHSRKRSLVSTTTLSSSSSSTSPHPTIPSPETHVPPQVATSLRLTITRPDGVVQSSTKVTNGGLTVDTSGERMVLV